MMSGKTDEERLEKLSTQEKNQEKPLGPSWYRLANSHNSGLRERKKNQTNKYERLGILYKTIQSIGYTTHG